MPHTPSPTYQALMSRLRRLDQLSPEARELGLREALEDEWYALREDLALYRSLRAQHGLHWAVNERVLWPRIVNQLRRIRKYERDPAHFARVVEDNLSMFEPDGRYYRFRFPGGRPA